MLPLFVHASRGCGGLKVYQEDVTYYAMLLTYQEGVLKVYQKDVIYYVISISRGRDILCYISISRGGC